jgi:hypothetical protein
MTDNNIPAVVDTVVEQPADFTVFATNPADMIGAQRSMILWCARKIQAEKLEMVEAQTNLDAAKANKWSHAAWAKQVKLRVDRIEFYKKIKMALEAGYYIVPPFPVDTFAIRVKNQRSPRGVWSTSRWRNSHVQKEDLLPAGEGHYVSPTPLLERQNFPDKDFSGKEIMKTHWRPLEFRAADFPFKLAKAEIMEATRAAMALKVFDRMGALPAARAPDPIICGEIIMPHNRNQSVTFFVSWWLDTRTL